MTVRELIDILADSPQDLPVVIPGYKAGYDDIEAVEIVEVQVLSGKLSAVVIS